MVLVRQNPFTSWVQGCLALRLQRYLQRPERMCMFTMFAQIQVRGLMVIFKPWKTGQWTLISFSNWSSGALTHRNFEQQNSKLWT